MTSIITKKERRVYIYIYICEQEIGAEEKLED
jgi:hypothetical protein